VLLGPALGELDWRVALYAVASLTVVRMLQVALAMLGMGMRWSRSGFLGWFGPRSRPARACSYPSAAWGAVGGILLLAQGLRLRRFART
jgi:hypothetical protein